MDGSTCVLIRVCSALSGDGIELSTVWLSWIYVAVLEDNSSVSEYEIHSAVDITFSVELSLGMCVQSVLVAFKAAPVKR